MDKKREQKEKCLSRNINPICTKCRKVLDCENLYLTKQEYLNESKKETLSHGLCEECLKELYPDFAEDILKKIKMRNQEKIIE